MDTMSSPGDVGVVTALPGEAAVLSLQEGDRLRVVVAGVGAQRSGQAARRLLDHGVKALASLGVAGGLSRVLKPGDLILAERLGSEVGPEHVSTDWNQSLLEAWTSSGVDVRFGSLWSHAKAVTSVHEKQQLAARGYDIVDMEAAAVAHVASAAGVPFVAIKCVCDPASRAVPPIALRLLRPDGRVRFSVLFPTLLRGPRMWRTLRCMSEDFDAACAGLARAVPVMVQSCRT